MLRNRSIIHSSFRRRCWIVNISSALLIVMILVLAIGRQASGRLVPAESLCQRRPELQKKMSVRKLRSLFVMEIQVPMCFSCLEERIWMIWKCHFHDLIRWPRLRPLSTRTRSRSACCHQISTSTLICRNNVYLWLVGEKKLLFSLPPDMASSFLSLRLLISCLRSWSSLSCKEQFF